MPFGIGVGGFWATGAGLRGRLVEEQHVDKATSIILAGVSISVLIGGSARALLGDLVGWHVAFSFRKLRAVIRICRRRRWLHVADYAVLDAERGHVDTPKLGIVGRAGANSYVGTSDVIKSRISRPVD